MLDPGGRWLSRLHGLDVKTVESMSDGVGAGDAVGGSVTEDRRKVSGKGISVAFIGREAYEPNMPSSSAFFFSSVVTFRFKLLSSELI